MTLLQPAKAVRMLTRRAMASWARWRLAKDAWGQQELAKQHGLGPAEVLALTQLRENLAAAGEATGWFVGCASSGAVLRREVADALLRGLDVEERAFPDFMRALRVNPIRELLVEKTLRERLAPGWKARRPPPETPERELSWEETNRRLGALVEREEQKERAMPAGTTGATGTTGGPERQFRGLRADIWQALQKRGIPIDATITTQQKAEIAQDAGTTLNTVNGYLSEMRKSLRCGFGGRGASPFPRAPAPTPTPVPNPVPEPAPLPPAVERERDTWKQRCQETAEALAEAVKRRGALEASLASVGLPELEGALDGERRPGEALGRAAARLLWELRERLEAVNDELRDVRQARTEAETERDGLRERLDERSTERSTESREVPESRETVNGVALPIPVACEAVNAPLPVRAGEEVRGVLRLSPEQQLLALKVAASDLLGPGVEDRIGVSLAVADVLACVAGR